MAGINRAFRRRLVWTLVAAALAAAILTGCGDKDQQPDDDAVVGELTRQSTTWLAGFGAPSSTKPGCLWTGFDVEVTAGTGSTPSKDVEACLGPNGNGRTLRVHNQTGVPITISGPGIIWFSPVQPNATVDIPLTVWHDGARFTFRPNVVVGVMMVLQDQIKDARVPKGLQGLRCSAQGFEHCLADHAPELLPEKTVRIGDLTVPVQQIAKLLTTLWEHRELARAFVGHITGEEGGALTLRQTP